MAHSFLPQATLFQLPDCAASVEVYTYLPRVYISAVFQSRQVSVVPVRFASRALDPRLAFLWATGNKTYYLKFKSTFRIFT